MIPSSLYHLHVDRMWSNHLHFPGPILFMCVLHFTVSWLIKTIVPRILDRVSPSFTHFICEIPVSSLVCVWKQKPIKNIFKESEIHKKDNNIN